MFSSHKNQKNKRPALAGHTALLLLGAAALLNGQAVAVASDPTQPPPGYGAQVSESVALSGALPTVTAILSAANRRLALIDGELAGVGDIISGGSIVGIERNHVLLRVNNKTVRLGVSAGEIRRHPSSGER